MTPASPDRPAVAERLHLLESHRTTCSQHSPDSYPRRAPTLYNSCRTKLSNNCPKVAKETRISTISTSVGRFRPHFVRSGQRQLLATQIRRKLAERWLFWAGCGRVGPKLTARPRDAPTDPAPDRPTDRTTPLERPTTAYGHATAHGFEASSGRRSSRCNRRNACNRHR